MLPGGYDCVPFQCKLKKSQFYKKKIEVFKKMNVVHSYMNGGKIPLREQKRQNLVDTATELLEEYRYHEITLDVIAKRVGGTKSNLYHYFKSKEELYLEVYLQQEARSVEIIEQKLSKWMNTNNYEAVVETIAHVMATNKVMNALAALLGTTLTQNISDQMAKNCENQTNNSVLRVSKSILSALPVLTFFEVEEFIVYTIALYNGLWAEVIASERYKQIFKEMKGSLSDETFCEQLQGGMLLMMKGLFEGKNT